MAQLLFTLDQFRGRRVAKERACCCPLECTEPVRHAQKWDTAFSARPVWQGAAEDGRGTYFVKTLLAA